MERSLAMEAGLGSDEEGKRKARGRQKEEPKDLRKRKARFVVGPRRVAAS